jgi:Ca2+-binding RTX toxin-like protein
MYSRNYLVAGAVPRKIRQIHRRFIVACFHVLGWSPKDGEVEMVKSSFSKVMSVGSTPILTVVLTVILALTMGLASVALAATLEGTEGPDILVGTGEPDAISGIGGDDLLGGLEANDELNGGPGDDNIYGDECWPPSVNVPEDCGATPPPNPGNDTLKGGSGNDFAIGGGGDDIINGGPDNDTEGLAGFDGDDTIYGGSDDGADWMWGDAGNDKLYGGPNADPIFGVFRDELNGGEGSDELHGSKGEDRLIPGSGADTVYGGPRRDVIKAERDGEVDHLNCGDHPHDRVEYEEGVDVVNADCENRFPL